MNTVFQVKEQLDLLKANGDNDSFGVFYQSASNPSNSYYVIVKSETEFNNLKSFHREYDFKFTKLAV